MINTDSEIETKAWEWRHVWYNYPGKDEESWQALVRHVLTQSAAIAPDPRDAETLARDWYECRYEHSAWKSAGHDARRDHLETAARFLALPHRAAQVGTIVCGEGLTAEQEAWPADTKLEEADTLNKLSNDMGGFKWRVTQEGREFWIDVSLRLATMAAALRASAAPKPPEPVDVAGFTVEQSGCCPLTVLIRNVPGDTLLTSTDTRALAAALNAAADAAEGKAAP
jgi:hypothetical protein